MVKAPLSGYVQQLVYHTKGGVVETAKPIMNLVPEEQGGNLYLVNGSFTKLADAGAFAKKNEKEETTHEE